MIAEPYICGIEGCKRTVMARGWCHMHYQRWHARNPVMNFREAVYQLNVKEGTTLIPLTQGKVAVVSPEDYDHLKKFKWHFNSCGYPARRVGKGPMILMHQDLFPDAEEVDHKNGDRLDYHRENLRPCNHSQNNANKPKQKGTTSQYKGVCRIAGTPKWQAGIQFEGKRRHLGHFDREIDAAKAYNQEAVRLFGQFAFLNPV